MSSDWVYLCRQDELILLAGGCSNAAACVSDLQNCPFLSRVSMPMHVQRDSVCLPSVFCLSNAGPVAKLTDMSSNFF